MIGKTKIKGASLFEDPLKNILNSKKPLYQLAHKIDWDFIEENLSFLYSKKGRKAHPIRLMAGLLILKSLRNLSDKVLVGERIKLKNNFKKYSKKLLQKQHNRRPLQNGNTSV